MTGFGSAEKNGFRVEIRSLNHRFMDISMKLQQLLSEHEIPMRKMLKEKFARGKFDVSVSAVGDSKAGLKFNEELAKDVYESLKALQSRLSIPGVIEIQTLLSYKELFLAGSLAESSLRQEYDSGLLYGAFNEAMEQLEKMRVEEGRAIAEDISNMADRVESLNKDLWSIMPDVIADYKVKFHERLREILVGDSTLRDSVEYDRDRVLQEVAIMIEKRDVTEELARIDAHIKQFRKILKSGDIIGKQLDFLTQEFNREANTVASKAGDYRIANIIIEMKSEIEKIREQVQNLQ
ncbi:MAG: YicC/YloC family endoribonuclease [Thermodesulfovibrionales bacterium]|nr:YicC/YloC family endoribonuclease [Thermodesulfovibrionales bacterium]